MPLTGARLGRTVYPYRRRFAWWTRNRFKHLADGIERNKSLVGADNRILRHRIKSMRRWLLVRAVVTPFLFASIISTAAGFVVDLLGVSSEARDTLALFQTLASTFAGLFLVIYFFANRTLGLLEADIHLALTVGVRDGQPDD